jgi:hypothetical protein
LYRLPHCKFQGGDSRHHFFPLVNLLNLRWSCMVEGKTSYNTQQLQEVRFFVIVFSICDFSNPSSSSIFPMFYLVSVYRRVPDSEWMLLKAVRHFHSYHTCSILQILNMSEIGNRFRFRYFTQTFIWCFMCPI